MPILFNKNDIKFFQQKNVEIFKNYFVEVEVSVLLPQEFTHVYGEDANKRYADPYKISAYMPELPGWKEKLTRFGFDESRELIIMFSLDQLKLEGRELPKVGDRVQIQDDHYTIMQSNPADFGSNLQIAMTHSCKLERYRPEKPEEFTTVSVEY